MSFVKLQTENSGELPDQMLFFSLFTLLVFVQYLMSFITSPLCNRRERDRAQLLKK